MQMTSYSTDTSKLHTKKASITSFSTLLVKPSLPRLN